MFQKNWIPSNRTILSMDIAPGGGECSLKTVDQSEIVVSPSKMRLVGFGNFSEIIGTRKPLCFCNSELALGLVVKSDDGSIETLWFSKLQEESKKVTAWVTAANDFLVYLRGRYDKSSPPASA